MVRPVVFKREDAQREPNTNDTHTTDAIKEKSRTTDAKQRYGISATTMSHFKDPKTIKQQKTRTRTR